MSLTTRAACVFVALLLAASSAVAQCNIRTSAINFGEYRSWKSVTSSGSLTVRCNAGVRFTIELSKGNGDFSRRKLQNGKGGFLFYNLYVRPDYRQIWGDGRTSGSVTVGGVGTGGGQNFTIFGRIPRGQKPEPGHYSDNVAITINF